MKLGIKVNTDHESIKRLARTNPSHAEVWFNINEKDRYTALFEELKRRQCSVGLHFWGQLDDNISPNIAYPDPAIIEKSMDLMRQTIDIASQNKYSYVNIHPGAAALSRVDYQQERYDVISDPIELEHSTHIFLKNAQQLNTYAASKNVVFTVETVPARITDGWYTAATRTNPKNIYELPVPALIEAARLGIPIANDFCHTGADILTDNPDAVWTFLLGTTKLLAPKTRLIHLGFVIPPYNGTDNHNSLDNPLLETSHAVPNKKQMIELLKLFQNRDDVWILAEPKEDHVKNYFIVKELLEQVEKRY